MDTITKSRTMEFSRREFRRSYQPAKRAVMANSIAVNHFYHTVSSL